MRSRGRPARHADAADSPPGISEMPGGHWRPLSADRVLVVDRRLSETPIHHKSASSPREGRRDVRARVGLAYREPAWRA
jgi:hypothetical protein